LLSACWVSRSHLSDLGVEETRLFVVGQQH
jgi:hypothetical protein